MRRALTTLVGLALVAAVALPVSGFAAGSGAKVPLAAKVNVGDDFYSKSDLQFSAGNKGKQVKFKWLPTNTDSHNVVLKSGPSSLTKAEKKDFKSAVGSVGVRFNPVFKKKGTYKFICTVHPTVMKLSVKVK